MQQGTNLCLALDPTLTTVDYRAEEVGRCMATGLLELVAGKVKSLGIAIRLFVPERESHRKREGSRASVPENSALEKD